MIQKLWLGIGSFLLGALMIAIGSVIAGTILWIIWPYAIPFVFPIIVKSGYLASVLSWKSSVLLTWICTILIKSSNSSK